MEGFEHYGHIEVIQLSALCVPAIFPASKRLQSVGCLGPACTFPVFI